MKIFKVKHFSPPSHKPILSRIPILKQNRGTTILMCPQGFNRMLIFL